MKIKLMRGRCCAEVTISILLQLKYRFAKFQKYKGHGSSSKVGLKDTISYPTYTVVPISTRIETSSGISMCTLNETCSLNSSTLNETSSRENQKSAHKTGYSDCSLVDIENEFTDFTIKTVNCHSVHYTAVFCMGQSHT